MFVSQASIDNGSVNSYGLAKRIEVVKNCRNISKHDLKFNGATPSMVVDPETFVSLPAFYPGLIAEAAEGELKHANSIGHRKYLRTRSYAKACQQRGYH